MRYICLVHADPARLDIRGSVRAGRLGLPKLACTDLSTRSGSKRPATIKVALSGWYHCR